VEDEPAVAWANTQRDLTEAIMYIHVTISGYEKIVHDLHAPLPQTQKISGSHYLKIFSP
ncbi:hypothetical protein RYX36_034701, partial [Vicia faba]